MHTSTLSMRAPFVLICGLLAGCSFSTLLHPNVIAEIGGERITTEMFLRQMKRSGGNPLWGGTAPAFVAPEIINQMILREALAYEARRLGYTVSDAELHPPVAPPSPAKRESKDPVAKNYGVLEVQGPVRLDQLAQAEKQSILQRYGYTAQEFELESRRDLLAGKLLEKLADGTVVTDQEAENSYRESKFTISLQYISFREEIDAKEAAAMFGKMGSDLGALARRFKEKLVACHGCPELWNRCDLTRKGNVGGIKWSADTTLFKETHDKPVGALVGPIAIDGEQVLCKVLKRVDADMKGFPAERDSIKAEIQNRKLRERQEAFQIICWRG